VKGQEFSVTFPTKGNHNLVCLVHENMTGVVVRRRSRATMTVVVAVAVRPPAVCAWTTILY
jgi:hypothetical protein